MTYITGKAKIDSQGRINVGNLFQQGKMPSQIILVVDVEQEQILILDAGEKDYGFGGIPQKIDSKNRLIIPKWILEEIGGYKEVFLVDEDGEKYISVKTGNILPCKN